MRIGLNQVGKCSWRLCVGINAASNCSKPGNLQCVQWKSTLRSLQRNRKCCPKAPVTQFVPTANCLHYRSWWHSAISSVDNKIRQLESRQRELCPWAGWTLGRRCPSIKHTPADARVDSCSFYPTYLFPEEKNEYKLLSHAPSAAIGVLMGAFGEHWMENKCSLQLNLTSIEANICAVRTQKNSERRYTR